MSEQPPVMRSRFDELLGTEWLSMDPDDARARIQAREELTQPLGLLHGGVISSAVESVCSMATAGAVWGEGKIALAQSLDISFLRPFTTDSITVVGRARHRGRSTWVWEVEARDGDDKVGALARMTIAVRARPSPRSG